MYYLIAIAVILIKFDPTVADINASGYLVCGPSCSGIKSIAPSSSTPQTSPMNCTQAISSIWTTNLNITLANGTIYRVTLNYPSFYQSRDGNLSFSGVGSITVPGCGAVQYAITLNTNPNNPIACGTNGPTSVNANTTIMLLGSNCNVICNGNVGVNYTQGVQRNAPLSCSSTGSTTIYARTEFTCNDGPIKGGVAQSITPNSSNKCGAQLKGNNWETVYELELRNAANGPVEVIDAKGIVFDYSAANHEVNYRGIYTDARKPITIDLTTRSLPIKECLKSGTIESIKGPVEIKLNYKGIKQTCQGTLQAQYRTQ